MSLPMSFNALVLDHGDGAVLDVHRHDVHLLLWSPTGTGVVRVGDRDWLLPASAGLWMPAGTPHAVRSHRPGREYGVAVDPRRCPHAWPATTAVQVTPLVRELIVYLAWRPDQDLVDALVADVSGAQPERTAADVRPVPAAEGTPDRATPGSHAQAESLLLSLLRPVPVSVFDVQRPADPRIRGIADVLLADPGDPRDLSAWADHVNSSVRTISRAFRDATGMTFAEWRARVRFRAAVVRLAQGQPVGTVARAVGYRKPSAFAAAFRRVTGVAPGDYRLPADGAAPPRRASPAPR